MLFITIALAFLTILSAIVINLFTGKKDVAEWVEQIRLHYLIGGVLVIGFASLLLVYLQFRFTEENEKASLAGNVDPDIKEFYDSLCERYQKRYESKLDERFEITLRVTEDWNTGKIQSITERYDKDAKISKAFPCIKKLFNEKDGLLIVGEPGTGKTVLLLKVALNLLANIDLAKKEAFPVIFNLASWSEEYADFGEWLKAMLVTGNGLSKDSAAALLQEKMLILLLDGLDELARNEDEIAAVKKRAACLKALNEYLDGEKNIICCRVEEFVQIQKNTAQDAPVSAKVEVLQLDEKEVLKALAKAQNHEDTKYHASARNLNELFTKRENTALRKLLCTPFYFNIALEVFYKRILDEINLPKDEEKLKSYLISSYAERKLAKTPNPDNFDKKLTVNWLRWLAVLMEKRELVTFELAELQKKDLSKRISFGMTTGLIICFIVALIFIVILIVPDLWGEEGLSAAQIINHLIFSVYAGLIWGVVGGVYYSFRDIQVRTEDQITLDFSEVLAIDQWLFGGVVFGIMAGFLYGMINESIYVGIGTFISLIVLMLLFREVLEPSKIKRIKFFAYLENPYQRLFGGLWVNLVFAVISLIIVALLVYFNDTVPCVLFIQFFFIILAYRSIGKIVLLKHFIIRIALWREGSIPLKYATFLDYASNTRIIEKDGGFWRFRHQNLQEHFANSDDRLQT